jgi:hypothetical protein
MRCLLQDGLATVYKPLAMKHLDEMAFSFFRMKVPNLAEPPAAIRKDVGAIEKWNYHQRFPYLFTVCDAFEVFVCSHPSGSTMTTSPIYTWLSEKAWTESTQLTR